MKILNSTERVAKLHALNDMVKLNLPIKLLNAFNDRRKEVAARK